MIIDADLLRRFVGRGAKDEVLAAIAASAPAVLPRFGITTRLRLQHFFAQLAEESGGFKTFEENLRYSAAGLRRVWPGRFPTAAIAARYANNSKALALKVYGGRMGNRPGTEDGWTYRGRGLIQLTGRNNYRTVGAEAGLPLIDNPDLASAPENLLLIAAAFWSRVGANAAADRDDIVAVTRRVNGGTVNLAARRAWLTKARKVFVADLEGAAASPVASARSSLAPAAPPSETARPVASEPEHPPPAPKPIAETVGGAIVVGAGAAAARNADGAAPWVAVVILLTALVLALGVFFLIRWLKGKQS